MPSRINGFVRLKSPAERQILQLFRRIHAKGILSGTRDFAPFCV